MTETAIADGIVLPQDRGMGLGHNEPVDPNSAGNLALMAQHVDGTYVNAGLDFDVSGETLAVTAGHAFIELDDVRVQADGRGYDVTLPDPTVVCVVLPAPVEDLPLDDGVNDVYLAFGRYKNNDVSLVYGEDVSAPEDPHVKLGTVDASDGLTTRASDEIPLSNDVDAGGRDISNVGRADIDAVVDGADVEHTGELADVTDLHARYTDEEVQDVIGALLSGGTNVTASYDDGNDALTIDTSALNEEEVEDAVAALLTTSSDLTLNYDDANDVLTLGLAEDISVGGLVLEDTNGGA